MSAQGSGPPPAALPWRVMGILNVTPDSFSDGGRFTGRAAVQAQVRRMVAEGAAIIDIGGESSRPGAAPVPVEEELARVIPAVEATRAVTDLPISVDTTKAQVARAALAAGADIINDISALTFDPEMVTVAVDHQCPLVIMHMQGEPRTMQAAPRYTDVVAEVHGFLAERVTALRHAGVTGDIMVDPGIGFGKTLEHNLALFKNLHRFTDLGGPLVVGHSRKSCIGALLDLPVTERDEATAVLSVLCAQAGAAILRVHDVGRTVRALRLLAAVTP